MSSPEPPAPRGQWTGARTFLFMIIWIMAAALAYYAAGFLSLAVVVIIGALTVSYFGRHQFANWQTGRPTRTSRRRADSLLVPPGHDGGALRAEPDAVESWLRERELDGVFEDRDHG
jgi:hypothetical protein